MPRFQSEDNCIRAHPKGRHTTCVHESGEFFCLCHIQNLLAEPYTGYVRVGVIAALDTAAPNKMIFFFIVAAIQPGIMSWTSQDIGRGFFNKVGFLRSFDNREITLLVCIAHTATDVPTVVRRRDFCFS